jgi:hypothetical protein
MSRQTKPIIVFARRLWDDGSCFSKVIPALQPEGVRGPLSQQSLDTRRRRRRAIAHRADRGPVQPER